MGQNWMQIISLGGSIFGENLQSRGNVLSRGTLYKLLSNPIYIGQIAHKGQCYPGQHEIIVDQAQRSRVQQHIADNRVGNKSRSAKTDPSPLAGKLFDVSGERLVPIHANKKGRRYRYYISQSLTTGTKDNAMSGWRLSAQELEQAVVETSLVLLREQEVIASALCHAEIKLRHVPSVLKAASEADSATIFGQFIQRVELRQDGMHLVLSLSSLVPETDKPITLVPNIPMRMKRRGVEMRMIIGDTTPTRIDPILIRTIAHVRSWYDDFVSGRVASLAEIATRYAVDKGYVSRVVSLALLAPDIVEDIVAGRQPPDLTAQKLLRQTQLPLDWAEQRRILGYR